MLKRKWLWFLANIGLWSHDWVPWTVHQRAVSSGFKLALSRLAGAVTSWYSRAFGNLYKSYSPGSEETSIINRTELAISVSDCLIVFVVPDSLDWHVTLFRVTQYLCTNWLVSEPVPCIGDMAGMFAAYMAEHMQDIVPDRSRSLAAMIYQFQTYKSQPHSSWYMEDVYLAAVEGKCDSSK